MNFKGMGNSDLNKLLIYTVNANESLMLISGIFFKMLVLSLGNTTREWWIRGNRGSG